MPDARDVSYLTIEQVLVIHFRLIQQTGGAQGVRDIGLLDAVMRPQSGFGDHELFSDLFTKAAALMAGIIQNHPFVDGNKRTGIAAARTFLRLHGFRLVVSQEELEDFTVSVAETKPPIDDIACWLRDNCQPADDTAD